MAWSTGDKETAFIARFKALIADRNDAEAFGDAEGVRAAEARLFRLTGVEYPTTTPTETPSTNGAAKTRTLRKSAPSPA